MKEFQDLTEDVFKKFIYLGSSQNVPYFAATTTQLVIIKIYLPQKSDNIVKNDIGNLMEEFVNLRHEANKLSAEESTILGYARGILEFQKTHSYCCNCGTKLTHQVTSYSTICSNCKEETYPRMDPAVIMLVHKGDNVLLASQKKWPKGRYSTLAGFVEVGETLENCVHREVKEEVGVEIESRKILLLFTFVYSGIFQVSTVSISAIFNGWFLCQSQN